MQTFVEIGDINSIKPNRLISPCAAGLSVGGFAGGELGVKTYVETGDIPLVEPGKRGRQAPSPLLIAGALGLAATFGGILLTDVEEVSTLWISVPPRHSPHPPTSPPHRTAAPFQ